MIQIVKCHAIHFYHILKIYLLGVVYHHICSDYKQMIVEVTYENYP